METTFDESLAMNSGFSIPVLGLGTYELRGRKGEEAINYALSIGYRNLDTAQIYGNEDLIGRCIKPYDRNSIFISSKIGPWQYGHSATLEAANNILSSLQTDYIDLLLLH